MRSFVCVLVVFAGCMDSGLYTDNKIDDMFGNPAIRVTPDSLDLGALGPGELGTGSFAIMSVGSESSVLKVSDITINETVWTDIDGMSLASDGVFSIMPPDGDVSFLLPEGRQSEVVVKCAPEHAGDYETLITVHSNDDNSPAVPVVVRCSGLMPELSIAPNPFDMGTLNVGCEHTGQVTLRNIGNADLVITSVVEDNEVFALAPPRLPMTLAPDEFEELDLTFAPRAATDYIGVITADSNEALGRRSAVQWGTGIVPRSFVDSYLLEANPMADIVFYVDQSPSMDNDQEELSDNLSRFIEGLSPYTPDWQIAVVTNDDGCTETGIMTPLTPGYMDLFRNASMNGEFGGNTERGLEIAYQAATHSQAGECNEGLLRDGALAHFIMVSDEADQSPRGWQFTVDEVTAVKGDKSLVKFSAVAGPVPSGCTEEDDGETVHQASAGTGYYEAVQNTGGVFLSLCSDWAENVAILASSFTAPTSYALSNRPDPFTIVVEVNDIVVRDWVYSSSNNAITFNEPAQPVEGDRIDIAYSEPYGCD